MSEDNGVVTVTFHSSCPTNHVAFAPADERRFCGAKLIAFVQPDGTPTPLQQEVSEDVFTRLLYPSRSGLQQHTQTWQAEVLGHVLAYACLMQNAIPLDKAVGGGDSK